MPDFNLDDVDELMDFVTYIFSAGKKVKGEYPVVGSWNWESYRIILLASGDLVMSDDREQKTLVIFSSDRTQNNTMMQTRGLDHRNYMIKEFMSWENLEKLDNQNKESENETIN